MRGAGLRAIRGVMWTLVLVTLAALIGLFDVSGAVLTVLIIASIVLFGVAYGGPSVRDWSAFHDTYGRAGGDGGPA